MIKILDFFKKYYLVPFLFLFSFHYHDTLTTLVANGNLTVLQIIVFSLLMAFSYFLSKKTNATLSHISIALLSIISQVYICIKSNSIQNLLELKSHHYSFAKFLAIVLNKALATPFNTFVLITFGAFLATVIFFVKQDGEKIDLFSSLLLNISLFSLFSACVLGQFEARFVISYPLALSIYTTRFYNKSFENGNSKFHYLLNALIILFIVYILVSNWILYSFIY